MTTTARTLILGAAIGYSALQLRPFLVSLQKTGYRGDLCLMVSFGETDPDTLGFLRASGVQVEPFESWRLMPVEINTARYIRCFEILLARRYDAVLLTDTRDVIFQSDPFALALPPDRPLAFFLEHDDVTLDTCASNSHWLRAAFGEAKVAALAGRPISCSGTTLGTQAGIMRYLQAMIQTMGQVPPPALKVTGIDQGIHNVLIQEGRLPGFTLHENGHHVLTMGHLPPERAVLRPDGIVANPDGTVPAVVHQYNYPRHESLCRTVLETYR